MSLIEFGGLPGTGKSTLALAYASRIDAVLLRIDTIEGALLRNGLRLEEFGSAAYGVAHDVAAGHLARGMTVIADAVNPVAEAREGWRHLAAAQGVRHVVVETVCPDPVVHRSRVEARKHDIADYPRRDWTWVQQAAAGYQPRTDERLVLDTTADPHSCLEQIVAYCHADEPDRTDVQVDGR